MKNELKNNQNVNGGGLATSVTGKFESNRNALAKLDKSKRTAGQVAASLRKGGLKIYAKNIKPILIEWHHAGMLPKAYGGGMAKTYYTNLTDEEIIAKLNDHQLELEEQSAINDKLRIDVVYVMGYKWESNYSGRYGKKVNFKEVYFEKSNRLKFENSKNEIEITEQEYKDYNYISGFQFFGWDEPTREWMLSNRTVAKKNKDEKLAKRRMRYAAKKSAKQEALNNNNIK